MKTALAFVGAGFLAGLCFGVVIGGYREWVHHTGGTWIDR